MLNLMLDVSNFTNSTVPWDGPTEEQISRWEMTAWAISGSFTSLACILSFYLIYMHLKHWNRPDQQIYIVRLLLMVPIYSIDSWLSIRWKDYGIYFDIGRDCYEAYVIYQFFALLTAYIENGRPGTLETILADKPFVKFPIPLCFLPTFKPSPFFVLVSKQCILQYVIIKPTCSIIAAILEATGHYHEGSFLPWYGYIYVTLIALASVTVSMYFLVWFYITTKDDLKPYEPVAKFICVKAVIFFSFWQSVLIAVLAYFHVVPENAGRWTRENISRGLQDFIICIEMFVLAVCHIWVFPYGVYVLTDQDNPYYASKGGKGNFTDPVKHFAKDVMNQKDVVKDVKNAYNPNQIKQAKAQHKIVKKRFLESQDVTDDTNVVELSATSDVQEEEKQ